MSRGARRDDPVTSFLAARPSIYDQPKKIQLLKSYRNSKAALMTGLTDEQAARSAGLERSQSYWKRCSDLRREGLIKPVYKEGRLVTDRGSSGLEMMVCMITAKGLQELLKRDL